MIPRLFVGILLAALVACDKSSDEAAPGDLFAKLSGTVQLPVAASRAKLFASGKAGFGLQVSWQSCVRPGETDKSQVIAGGAVLVESTASCTGSPYLTVSAPELIDLTAFAKGTLHFTVEVSAVGQSLELLVQDGTTKTSVGVDLSQYGFDATKTAVPQAVTVPGNLVATNGVDMAHLKRPFQVNLTCTGSDCQAKFDSIEWWGGEAIAAADTSPVRSGSIGLLTAKSGGWAPAGAVVAVTAASGAYSVQTTFPQTAPAFLIVADNDTGFNFLARIPPETLSDSEAVPLTVDVDLATTLAAMAEFPGGNVDAPDYFEHPKPAEFSKQLADAIRAYLEVKQPTSADPAALLPEVLQNPSVLQVLNAGRQAAGKSGETVASQIVSANQAAPAKFGVPVN